MERQKWVDVAKGIAMIAIVLGHIHFDYPDLSFFPISTLFFWLWHVPVFFLIGGFFLKDNRLLAPLSFIMNKYKKIGLKVLVISVPLILIHNILVNLGFYDPDLLIGGYTITYYSTNDFIKQLLSCLFMHTTEAIVDPLWFAQVLFWALSLLSLLYWSFNKKLFSDKSVDKYLLITLLLVTTIGCFICNKLSDGLLGISSGHLRFIGSILTATWLLYLGKKIYSNESIFSFDNSFIFIICLIVLYIYAVFIGPVNIRMNRYSDIISLSISSFAALYIIAYISKKCSGLLSRVLSLIGENSFYIMGLHLIAFKPCTMLLNLFGHNISVAQTHAISTDILSYVIYSLGGGVFTFSICARHQVYY